MSDNFANLDGGRFLADLYSKDSIQAAFMQRLINAINGLGRALGSNAVGLVQTPPQINAVNVKVSGEMMHVSLNHNPQINKHCHYFVEISPNDPAFGQPIVHYLGPSRTPPPFPLPSTDDTGSQVAYYVRAYPQYLGSKPAEPTVFGGALGAAAIKLTGSTALTLLPSTGSGTGSASGQQGGVGFGKFPVKPSILRVGKGKAIVPAAVMQMPIAGPSQSQGNALFPLLAGSGSTPSTGWNILTTETVTVPAGTASITFSVQLAAQYLVTSGVFIEGFGISITSGSGPATPQATANLSGNIVLNSPVIGGGLTLSLYYFGVASGAVTITSFTETIQSIIITP